MCSFFTISEIVFVKECREIAAQGKEHMRRYTALLDPMLRMCPCNITSPTLPVCTICADGHFMLPGYPNLNR